MSFEIEKDNLSYVIAKWHFFSFGTIYVKGSQKNDV